MIPKISEETFQFGREVLEVADTGYSLNNEKWRIRDAEGRGLMVKHDDKFTLLFDLDGKVHLDEFKFRVGILAKKGMDPKVTVTKSEHGNYHAVVELFYRSGPKPELAGIDEPLRIAIQAILGSDWKREMLNVLRLIHNKTSGNVLFQPQPLEVVEVITSGIGWV